MGEPSSVCGDLSIHGDLGKGLAGEVGFWEFGRNLCVLVMQHTVWDEGGCLLVMLTRLFFCCRPCTVTCGCHWGGYGSWVLPGPCSWMGHGFGVASPGRWQLEEGQAVGCFHTGALLWCPACFHTCLRDWEGITDNTAGAKRALPWPLACLPTCW